MARHIHVSGRVQGVGFRWSAEQEAQALGLRGWVRNLSDGRVEAWVQGEPEAVENLVGWMAEGPPQARVDEVDVRAVEPKPDAHDPFRHIG